MHQAAQRRTSRAAAQPFGLYEVVMALEENSHPNSPSEATVRALLDVIAPRSTIRAIQPLDGSYSNFSHLVQADSATGTRLRVVIRRYAGCGASRAAKAHLEFKTLEWLQGYDVPVPKPLFLDENGTVLGIPGIVTSYMPGKQVMPPLPLTFDPLDWARALATMLARIHSIPCNTAAKGLLLDADAEAVWFLRSGHVPAYMDAHPDGRAVWQAVHDLLPGIQPVEPALVHIDYWPGNILWDQGRITAVVDWEEAARGDPAIDVAYCRMNMILDAMEQAADVFLSTYQAAVRRQVENLGLWELAAAARPMIDPQDWGITEPLKGKRFRRFIADARSRA